MTKKQTLFFGFAVLMIAAIFTVACDNGTTDPHTHTYSAEWSKDGTQHWHECTANDGAKTDVANHTYGEWITGTPATVTTAGSRHRECSICGYAETEVIPATGIILTITGATALNTRSAYIEIFNEADDIVAASVAPYDTFLNGTATFALKASPDWTEGWDGGSEDHYYIRLNVISPDTYYGYTGDGADWAHYSFTDNDDIPLSQFTEKP